MENNINKDMKMKIVCVVVAVAVLVFGYWYSNKQYKQGYKAAVADIKAQQVDASNKATKAAVDQANPFKVGNPLEGVQANPFEKAKKTLNPFD